MNCYGCKCNFCARSCELFSGYFTPGEVVDVEKVCYTCDECKWWDGDHRKRSQWRGECPGYMEAAKHIEARERAAQNMAKRRAQEAEEQAKRLRATFKVIPGGKSCGIVEVSHETTNNKPK